MPMKTPTRIKIVIMIVLLIAAVQADTSAVSRPPARQSWKSGATTVTLSPDGTLRVSGAGGMGNYDHYRDYPPWRDLAPLITKLVIEEGVTHIGKYAFSGLSGIKSVTIPKSVTAIQPWAFAGCAGLTSLAIPGSVKSIGGAAFYKCTGLTSITIPGSVAEIEWEAFRECHGLTSVTIEDGVKSIGESAFYKCTGLQSVTIPGSVTFIGERAFACCNSLTSITVQSAEPPEADFCVFDDIDLNNICLYIPKGRIDAYRAAEEWKNFKCLKALKSVPGGGRRNVRLNESPPDTRLGANQPDKRVDVKTWDCGYGGGSNVTATLKGDGTLVISGTGRMWSYDSDSDYDYSRGLAPWYEDDQVADIKDSIVGVIIEKGVESVGTLAFYDCTNLTSVTIPSSVTSVGDNPFYDCAKLVSINVDKNNPQYSSVDGVLFNKTQDCLIFYPQGKKGVYAVPNSVKTFGEGAFYNCTGLTSINVNKGNPAYSSVDGVLFDKSQKKLIRYPQGKRGAYTIPDSVKIVKEFAFSGSPGLTSITIPRGIMLIERGAFIRCKNLKSVIVMDPSPPKNDSREEVYRGERLSEKVHIFKYINWDKACLYVPKGSIAAYRAAEGWENFKCIKDLESVPGGK